jgi:hypothetical protein
MHRHALEEQQRHQQVVEDLVNYLLCHSSSFVSTTPAQNPPLRRRRQRPPQSVLCNEVKEVERTVSSPLERTVISHRHSARRAFSTPGPASIQRDRSGSPAVAFSPQHRGARKPPSDRTSNGASPKSIKDGASRGPTPTASPKHDSLLAHSRRKFLWTDSRYSPSARSSDPDSPLAHAPRHRHLCGECASRAHSREADARKHASPTMQRRTQSAEPLSQPAQPLGHFPVEHPRRAQSLRERTPSIRERAPSISIRPSQPTRAAARRKSNVASGLRSVHLKAVAQALIAGKRMGGRFDLHQDMAMMQWERQERMELAERKRQARAAQERAREDGAPPGGAGAPVVARQPTSAGLKRVSSESLEGSKWNSLRFAFGGDARYSNPLAELIQKDI